MSGLKYRVVPAVASLMMVVGCQSAPVQDEVQTPEMEGVIECYDNKAVYEQLLFSEIGKEIAYDGYAEYGHLLTLEKIEETKEGDLVYRYHGLMNDGLGDEDGSRSFELTYTLTSDALVETIENHDEYRLYEETSLLDSIIPNKVLLKGNLKTGTTWKESFEYQGQPYTAINELTVLKTEEGATQYRVDTIVENIPDFVNHTYTETRVFEEGLGLISFTNISPLTFFEEEYQLEYPDREFYLFGYSRSGERVFDQSSKE